ncbi:MAG TPA: serine/threonine-protein kinase, partial [Candidatus Saccharimonadales bacterium]|nr:serine/threonine-protein kinase [Candidatus Saccharimonadales bacterium]
TPPEPGPKANDHSFGNYQLEELIGRGGMGVVYKARDRSLNRLVALKMIQSWRDASLSTLIRFRLEAEAAAKLDHPNIVPTYHIGEREGQPFFSMKLIPGGSLGQNSSEWALVPPGKDKNAKTASSSAREAQVRIATLMAKVARAVHYAHQHGVIHRDLKPNNILVDPDGEPHLTDFGIAKLMEQESGLTGTHDILGTPAYMAPEQANGKAVSAAVDIYSLGAILFGLLTGQPPFRGLTPLETLRKATEEEPVSPTTINPGVDRELASVCLKCLEKDPMSRYASALEMAEDLERWMRHEPILAKRAGPFLHLSRWVRRNPVGASLIATLCAGLVGALVLLQMVRAEKDRRTSALHEVEKEKGISDRAVRLTVQLLDQQLEALWQITDLRVLKITSEQLSVLSARPIPDVPRNSKIERFSFGLAANESPGSDARRTSPLLEYLEEQMTQRRKHPVRIDLKLYKYKEDRVQAIVDGEIDFARMGTFYYLQTKEKHPEILPLVEPDSMAKMATFFARADSGIKTLADLKGRSLVFGDGLSSITVGGQLKLLDAGLAGKDLGEYAFLDSRSEFNEEIHDFGYEAAVQLLGWLHSTADVIEDVLKGRYVAGATTDRGFEKHKHRGLIRISGSGFERRPSPWVGRGNLPSDVARDFVEIMIGLHEPAILLQLPDRPSGFKAIDESSHSPERASVLRLKGLYTNPLDQARLTNQVSRGNRKRENQ